MGSLFDSEYSSFGKALRNLWPAGHRRQSVHRKHWASRWSGKSHEKSFNVESFIRQARIILLPAEIIGIVARSFWNGQVFTYLWRGFSESGQILWVTIARIFLFPEIFFTVQIFQQKL